MLRTISLLALALVAHVTLVAALANACGPQCNNRQLINNVQQHNALQLQLGNRTINSNKNGFSLSVDSARLPQPTTAKQPTAIKPQKQSTEHPSDLPTNDPPVVAAK